MFPYTFEAVTALTIVAISAILILYFIVLKRMGWLREEASPVAFLCPNPECNRMFQEPLTLTDLSQKPPRKHFACPHCGVILTASPSIIQEKTVKPPHREKPKLTIEELLSMTETEKQRDSEEPIGLGTAMTPMGNPGNPKPINEQLKAKPLSETSKEQLASVPGCPHYYGYLQTIPKNAPLPKECFGCSKMVDCFLRRAEQ